MVTCQQCLSRLSTYQSKEDPRTVRERYEIGNTAKSQMGHAMYFTKSGRTALCVAAPKPKTVEN